MKKTTSQSGVANTRGAWPISVPPPPLTFAFVGRAVGEGVSIETVLAAVAEEAVCVVDALQTFSGLTVTVPDRIWVNIIAALASATRSARSTLTERVSKEAIITEFTAFTCQETNNQEKDLSKRQSSSRSFWDDPAPGPVSPQGLNLPVVPAGQLVQTTSLLFRITAQVAPAGQGHG